MPTYICLRASSPVTIDGSLSHQAWSDAKAVELVLHDESGRPQMQTTARLCYDDSYLYVGFECKDKEILATWTNRDDPIFSEEVVEIFIDPDCDRLAYYEFELSPRNVIFDASVANPTGCNPELDTSWDCYGLLTAVMFDNDGNWSAAMAIPFSALLDAPNTPPKSGDQWLTNLYRIKRIPKTEYMCWSPTLNTPVNFHVPARFGVLRFE